ncbi:MAG: hypothetical protein JWM04_1671, partial [Verrucomicrobiales bacterium]|nr:hypothetical protein [Verrucomicrobiales bacterium]
EESASAAMLVVRVEARINAVRMDLGKNGVIDAIFSRRDMDEITRVFSD